MAIREREWHEEIASLKPSMVRLQTPQASGSGFLLSHSEAGARKFVAIATAAHVVDSAHYWEQPIRVVHEVSGKSLLLRPADRAILLNGTRDSGALNL